MAPPKKNATPDTSPDGDLTQPPVAPDPPADTPVTMADAFALNGIEFDPDEPERAPAEPAVFISAGMASDLEQQGWCVSPITGQKIVRDTQE